MRRARTRLEERLRARRRRLRLRKLGLTARGTVPVRPDLSKPRAKPLPRRRRARLVPACGRGCRCYDCLWGRPGEAV